MRTIAATARSRLVEHFDQPDGPAERVQAVEEPDGQREMAEEGGQGEEDVETE